MARVAIVDDDQNVVAMLRALLTEAGHEVMSPEASLFNYNTSKEDMAKSVREFGPDIVLLDHDLRCHFSGDELLPHLGKTKVISITSSSRPIFGVAGWKKKGLLRVEPSVGHQLLTLLKDVLEWEED